MKYINKLSVAVVAVAVAATVPLASPSDAQENPRSQQPSPAGSVLDGRLSEMNENGAYFAKTPYTDAPASRAVGRLLVAGSLCTGSVVDSPKGNLVLTAAHCIADWQPDGTWKISDRAQQAFQNGQASITPAFDGTETGTTARNPLGYWKITNAHVPSSSGVDVAILETEPNDQGQNIQSVTGAFGVRGLKEGEVVQASLIGYPGPAPFNGNSQSVCVGNYTKHPQGGNSQISRVSSEQECWVGGGSSGGPYVTNSSDPRLAGDIITVLNSNGGGDIAPLMDELYAAAGNSTEPTETAKPTETVKPTEPATSTTVPTESAKPTGTVKPTVSPTATTTAAGTTKPEESTKPTATTETAPTQPSEPTEPTASPTATTTAAATTEPPELTESVRPTRSVEPTQPAAKPTRTTPTKTAEKTEKKASKATTTAKKSPSTPGNNITKEAKKVPKKDRPVFTTGGSLKKD